MPDHFDHGLEEHRRRFESRREAIARAHREPGGRERLRGLRRVTWPRSERRARGPRQVWPYLALTLALFGLFVLAVEAAR